MLLGPFLNVSISLSFVSRIYNFMHISLFQKPKCQMEFISAPNLVHILILLGFAKKIEFLAVLEVRPNLTSSSAENTKDFQNL